tara:strand:+ start:4535 stop:5113 length:579 start_codon:yes stop_codon:yes gene_type:complete
MFNHLFILFIACTTTDIKDSAAPQQEEFDFSTVEMGVQHTVDCAQYFNYTACDLILKDQNDEYFRLYDHIGKVIILDFSTGWCGPCQIVAATVQETQDLYNEQDFLYVTVLIEDNEGIPTTEQYASQWAETYNITTAPVLQGSRHLIDYDAIEGYNLTGWPTFYVINRNMEIVSGLRGFNEEWLTERIEENL